ncbi:MAG: hypothetical protein ABW067_06065 [Rhizobacter sp.]
MLAALFALYALAVFRLTRLLVADKITERPRLAIVKALPDGNIWAYFVMCPWCVSIWVSLVAAPVTWWFGGLDAAPVSAWLSVPALVLAYSAVTGILSNLAEE